MKTKLFCIVLTIILTAPGKFVYAQSPNWLWANAEGGLLNDNNRAVVTDALGNVYTTGSYQGSIDMDPTSGVILLSAAGDLDIFVTKSDGSGNVIWAKSMGGPQTDEGSAITVDDAGNVYVTGHFQNTGDFDPGANTFSMTSSGNYDVFISKLDGSGNFLWAGKMGGPNLDEGLGITVDSLYNIYTTGYFTNTADFDPDTNITQNMTSAGGNDVFVSRLNSSGQYVWAKQAGGATSDHGVAIALDHSLNIVVTGFFTGTADFDPGPNIRNLISAGARDIFFLMLNNSGTLAWTNSIGGTGADEGMALALDNSANIYATGFFSNTVDFDPDNLNIFNMVSAGAGDLYIFKCDSLGAFVWAKSVGSNANEKGQGIAYDPANGGVYLTGYYSGIVDFDPAPGGITNLTSNGGDEIFVLKLTNAGAFAWAKTVGGNNADYGYGIALNAAANAFVAGTFSSATMAFGTTTVSNIVTTGFPDIFLAKLDNSPTISCSPNLIPDLLIYPVPANEALNVELLTPMIKGVQYSIYDLEGRLISSGKLNGNSISTINTKQLEPGIYILNLYDQAVIASRRFTIVR